ncbi:hypothetical protein F3J27_00055 [Enterobacter sp. Ap-916]|uniref:hypothetical protein n=1 Tax=Enterobacteriaceae TaxID=543 RepID=UPI000272B330|nr:MULTISPECIES: hypothetical protein [unclassified Enterobacter]EJF30543.1 hypothetical protein A936_15024 [Enterobacter sp. Ag1]NIF58184.1 hypothetical protein [Enterobacter sp. Ap-867]NIG27874.1 hypothetical protein [Enterobacter sp. Ap-916]
MSTMIKFNLTNQSSTQQDFFFFQKPAIYSGGSNVYSNSIQSIVLAPYSTSSSTYTFLINMQFYAGVQQANTPPVVGKQSGFLSAIRPIDLTPATGTPSKGNSTSLSLNPFGLSSPVTDAEAEPGSFRIVSPVFSPNLNHVNGGSAVMLGDGSVVLSNFTTVLPNQNLDCQPILKYYIQTGSYQSGTVMNFTSSSNSAALCDATEGESIFDVTYNADGTWTVVSSC